MGAEKGGDRDVDTVASGAIVRPAGNTGETIVAGDVPAGMRNDVASLCELVSCDLNREVGAWFASAMGLEGGLEVNVSVGDENVVIVVMDDDFPDLNALNVLRLAEHGFVMPDSAGDTFLIGRDRFYAAMNPRLNEASIADLAGC